MPFERFRVYRLDRVYRVEGCCVRFLKRTNTRYRYCQQMEFMFLPYLEN